MAQSFILEFYCAGGNPCFLPSVGPDPVPPFRLPFAHPLSSLLSLVLDLGNNVAGTQSFGEKCELQATARPSVLSSESPVSELRWLSWPMLGEDLPELRNRPLFPGPGGAEVGLSQEGALWEGGEERGPFRSRCSWLWKESRSQRTSAGSQTIRSFGK